MLWSRSEYILGKDQRRFEMVGIRGIRNYPSDHFILRVMLLIYPIKAGHYCKAGGLLAQMVNGNGGINDTGI